MGAGRPVALGGAVRDHRAGGAYAGGPGDRDEGRGLSWYFLTTLSVRELMPLVEGFGQDVRYSVDRTSGRTRRELSHVLKVFLIDRAGRLPWDQNHPRPLDDPLAALTQEFLSE